MSGFLSLYAGTERVAVGPEVDRAAAMVTRLAARAKDAGPLPPGHHDIVALQAAKDALADAAAASEYSVTIKQYLTNTDYADAQRALVVPKMRGGEVTGTLESEAYQQIVVLKAITAWNLTDAEGADLPVTLDTVRALPQSVFIRLYGRITELNNQGDLDVPAGASEREVAKAEAQFLRAPGLGDLGEEAAGGPEPVDAGGNGRAPVLAGESLVR